LQDGETLAEESITAVGWTFMYAKRRNDFVAG